VASEPPRAPRYYNMVEISTRPIGDVSILAASSVRYRDIRKSEQIQNMRLYNVKRFQGNL